MKKNLLTLDIGTGSTRAALVTPDGTIVGFAQREYSQTSPQPGWVEQSPSLWWHSACDGIRELNSRFAQEMAHIAAIAVCGQMHGTVLLDSAGHLVEDRALLWNDKRAWPQVAAFREREEMPFWLTHLNNPPTPAWPAFKLQWIREYHPNVWARVASVLMPKDFINFRLTGVRATDYSEASCYYLMDSATRQWSHAALDRFQLSADLLPDIHAASDVIGSITPEAARETGLRPGIPVVAGTADMAASLLGSGVYQPGQASDSTGTSTLITVVSDAPLLHPQVNNLHLSNAAWGGFTLLDAGGDAMRWAREAFGGGQHSHPEMLRLAAETRAGAEGLLFLPYLTGERLADKCNSRGQLFGLQRRHAAGHLYRAVLEGVAFASWRNLRQLSACCTMPDSIIASGGGSRSELWLSIKASVYNRPIQHTVNQENGTLGCAILAATGIGCFSDLAQGVQRMVHIAGEIQPDARLHDAYQRQFDIFDQLYLQAQPLWDRLDAASACFEEQGS
ncbi:FGGY family carbohydrate kinase [Pantoea sp. BRR-3P]|uniref:xylulokinase n=1 Tax=Pantoea sp. BRR-3P TaxID=3141541 RepID=UPI0031F52188